MATTLPVKRGISSPAVTNIPQKWDQQWFRYFIDNFLTGADIRNVTTPTGSGITISGGNVSGNSSTGQGSGSTVVITQTPIPNNTVMGNVSGSTAIPVPVNQAQLTAIINLFSATLSGAVPLSGGGVVNFLRADGTWAPPAGSTAIPNNTVLGNVSGASAIPVAINQTQLTALINLFSSTLSGAVPLSGGGTTNFLRADGAWAAPPVSTGVNPSASVGLTAVNGVATTFLRSDGAPALSQAIVPTWSGVHTFSARPAFNLGATVSGGSFISRGISDLATAVVVSLAATGSVTIGAPSATNIALTVNGASTAVAHSIVSGNSSTTGGADLQVLRAGSTVNQIGQGPGMVMSDTTNLTSMSWQHSGGQTELWQNNSGVVSPTWRQVLKVLSTQGLVINAPISGNALAMTALGEILKISTSAARGAGQGYLAYYDTTGLKGYVGFAGGTDAMFIGNNVNNVINFDVNATTRMVLGAGGGLAISTPTAGDTLTVGPSVTSGALMATSAALTTGAGASAGTLTNAPSAGNPTKWIKINDNGTIRSIPAW